MILGSRGGHFSTLGRHFWRLGRHFGTPEEGCGIWVVVDGKRLQPIEVASIYVYMINP